MKLNNNSLIVRLSIISIFDKIKYYLNTDKKSGKNKETGNKAISFTNNESLNLNKDKPEFNSLYLSNLFTIDKNKHIKGYLNLIKIYNETLDKYLQNKFKLDSELKSIDEQYQKDIVGKSGGVLTQLATGKRQKEERIAKIYNIEELQNQLKKFTDKYPDYDITLTDTQKKHNKELQDLILKALDQKLNDKTYPNLNFLDEIKTIKSDKNNSNQQNFYNQLKSLFSNNKQTINSDYYTKDKIIETIKQINRIFSKYNFNYLALNRNLLNNIINIFLTEEDFKKFQYFVIQESSNKKKIDIDNLFDNEDDQDDDLDKQSASEKKKIY